MDLSFTRSNIMFVELVSEYHGKPAGERIHVADADAERLVQEGVAQSIADDPIAPLVMRALQPGLDSAVERAVQQALRKHGAAARPPFAGAGGAAVDDPKAGFKNFGELDRKSTRLNSS